MTLEKRFPAVEFSEDAAECPDIDGPTVRGGGEQDLGGLVPASGHVLCHWRVLIAQAAGHAEIADLGETAAIEEDVRRLEISVDHPACVQVGQPLEHLIDDVPAMGVFDESLSDELVQVCLHELEHQAHVLCSAGYLLQPDQVWVLHL
jgi:hypothetical protein